MPQDLRPTMYSAYNKRAKSTVLKKDDSPKIIHTVVPTESSPEKKKPIVLPIDASKTGIERRALITEIGGFKHKKVL